MERSTYLRDVQRRALVQHVGGLGADATCATFIGQLQDRGFRIVPCDGVAARWFAEHQIEGDPATTAVECEFEHPHPDHPCGRRA